MISALNSVHNNNFHNIKQHMQLQKSKKWSEDLLQGNNRPKLLQIYCFENQQPAGFQPILIATMGVYALFLWHWQQENTFRIGRFRWNSLFYFYSEISCLSKYHGLLSVLWFLLKLWVWGGGKQLFFISHSSATFWI